MLLPSAITNAIEALSDLPGIGNRSAERLVFTLLRNETGLEQKIGEALGGLKKNIQECEQCCFYSEETLCPLCQNPERDPKQLCIVESPTDVIALERTHQFRGLYHVLHGVISPLQKVKPEDVRIPELLTRLQKHPEIQEIILALPGSTEGEATALYLRAAFDKPHHTLPRSEKDDDTASFSSSEASPVRDWKVSRLARGIPSGGDLDYLDVGTLTQALTDRRDW